MATDTFGAISEFFASPLFKLFLNLFMLFIFVLYASLIYWTYRDAKRRGAMGIYWAVVVLVFNFFGWLVYMILRPPEFMEDAKERELEIRAKEATLSTGDVACPACARPIERDFLICPHCLKKLKRACPSCSRPLRLSWKVCPYCKASI